MENKLNLTPEQLEQAKTANSADALLLLAQENGIAMTCEQAAEYYAELCAQVGELSDEEMDNVSGGLGSANGNSLLELIAEILNEYCHSCRYYTASCPLADRPPLSAVYFVCKRCPNLETFNYRANRIGYRGFRRHIY